LNILAVIGAGLLLGWTACNSASVRANVKGENQRKTAPDFTLKDADGRTVHLSDYRNKVVLLDFWATWCGPCKVEIPWFTEFERKHKDRGFAVLGVSMDEGGWTEVKPFLKDLSVNYRVVMGDDRTAEQFGGIEALPTTFLIDRNGRIASTHVGLSGKKDFEDEIEQLLAQDANNTANRMGFATPFAGLLRAGAAPDGFGSSASHR
jgi:peroxiredoxin